jgi:hypothetical protein
LFHSAFQRAPTVSFANSSGVGSNVEIAPGAVSNFAL